MANTSPLTRKRANKRLDFFLDFFWKIWYTLLLIAGTRGQEGFRPLLQYYELDKTL